MVYAFCILLVFAFAFYGFSFFCVLHLWNILVGDHRRPAKKIKCEELFLSSFIVVWFLHGFFIFLLIISHCVVKGSFAHTPHRKRYCCLMLMWINWVFLQCPFICLLLHHLSYSTHLFNAFVLFLLAIPCAVSDEIKWKVCNEKKCETCWN